MIIGDKEIKYDVFCTNKFCYLKGGVQVHTYMQAKLIRDVHEGNNLNHFDKVRIKGKVIPLGKKW